MALVVAEALEDPWTATWIAMVSRIETALMVAEALEVPWDHTWAAT